MAKKQTEKSATYLVPALERGLKILELLAENPGGLLMGEMGALDLPSASLYRMLVTLTEMGYVVRDNGDRYHLGRKLLTLGYKGLDHAGLPEKSAAPMRALRNAVNETVVLGVLSGGEGQKISIARAFTKDSSILLLDEPSSALDPVAEYQMYETLMRACKDKSVVFISHRMSSAVLADRILLLDNGEIIEEGSHSELMAKDGKYAELFRVQAQNYISEGQEVRT